MTKKNVFYYIMWVMHGTENKDFHRYKLLKTRGGECGVKSYEKILHSSCDGKGVTRLTRLKNMKYDNFGYCYHFFPRFLFSSSNYRRKYGLTVRAHV